MDDDPIINDSLPETPEQNDKPRSPRYSGWVLGAILIGVGLLLMLQNLGGFSLENWWALFILIPAIGAFSRAWSGYQDAGGRLTSRVRSALFGGLILVLVTAMFLLNLNWVIFGPLVLILAGVGLLFNAVLPR